MTGKTPSRYYLAVVSSLIPATIYVALAYYMPLQYQFVVEDAVARIWPAFYATAISIFYAASSFLLFKRHGILTPAPAFLAATPAIAATISWWMASGLSTTLVFATLATGLALIGLYRFILQRSTIETTWASLGGALSLFLLFALADAVSPIQMPQIVGALAILALFAGLIGILLSAAWLHPKTGIVSVVYCAIAILFFSSNDHVVPNRPSTFHSTTANDALQKWLPERMDLETYRKAGLPYPVIFVSSEGGGIYAAAHAYEVLSILDRHCPTFSQHVLLTVGVSGGAIGNALFAASIDPAQKAYAPCTSGEIAIDNTPFSKDHLSPVLARLLLLESVDRLVPGPWLGKDRAFILTESFRSASPKDVLDRLVGEGFDPKSARPTVMSVATNVANGRRFVMSPISAEGTAEWWPGGQIASQRDTSIIEAAGISARFPWLTPTARLPRTGDAYRLLADGGYFDNSGADTVFDIISSLRQLESTQANDVADGNGDVWKCRLYMARNFRTKVKWNGCDLHIFPIHLAITSTDINAAEEPISDETPQANPTQSFLFDPITTLLSTRNSRGALALARSREEQCGTDNGECAAHTEASLGFFRSTVSPDELKLPLGWFMSENAVRRLSAAAIPVEAFDYKAGPENNQNDIAPLIHHLDVSLFAKGAKPSVEELLGPP
jgi:hypothetical protein